MPFMKIFNVKFFRQNFDYSNIMSELYPRSYSPRKFCTVEKSFHICHYIVTVDVSPAYVTHAYTLIVRRTHAREHERMPTRVECN